MPLLVDLTYYSETGITNSEQLIARHEYSLRYAHQFQSLSVLFVKHAAFEKNTRYGEHELWVRKGTNSRWKLPFGLHAEINKKHPVVVLVHGLLNPLQLIVLWFQLSSNTKIWVQHHGEKPPKGWKKNVLRLADFTVDNYFFVSHEQAADWLGIIDVKKVVEVMEAAPEVQVISKEKALQHTRIDDNVIPILWVGRLNANKDPLTALRAFREVLKVRADVQLVMIYQENTLEALLETYINEHPELKDKVTLKGKVEPENMPYWYVASDYFLSTSHYEGSGYAVAESMAYGCIPVLSNIASFRKMSGQGKYAFLFKAGDHFAASRTILQALDNTAISSEEVKTHFEKHLSAKAIAETLELKL